MSVLFSFGESFYNGLGIPGVSGTDIPFLVGAYGFIKVASASAINTNSHVSFGLAQDGTLWAWGEDANNGHIGLGNFVHAAEEPTQIGTDDDWTDIASGETHALAIKEDGSLWVWGSCSNGEMGLGEDLITRYSPFQIGTDTDWERVSAGVSNSYVIKRDGTLWSCGSNQEGQLGLGISPSSSNVNIFTKVGSDSWLQVAGGYNEALALRSDGTLWFTGADGPSSGLGGDWSTHHTTLTEITAEAGPWKSIGRGFFAIKENGELYGWGYNYNNELGLGSSADNEYPYPTLIDTGPWVKVDGFCAIKEGGTLWSWGNLSPLGQGATTESPVPAQVDDTHSVDIWTDVATNKHYVLGVQGEVTASFWTNFRKQYEIS